MKRTLLAAGALLALSTTAQAALWQVNYVSIVSGNPSGIPSPGVIGGTATYTYDDVTNTLSGSGTSTHVFAFGPNTIYSHSLTDLAITGTGVASATAYSCTNGAFAAAALFRDVCAGYSFGGNQVNESTVTPDGLSVTLGGDDLLQGTPQTLSNNFDMTVRGFTPGGPIAAGTYITLNRTSYAPNIPGTFQMTFQVIPVPGAVWLLGSAIGVMGLIRRRLK